MGGSNVDDIPALGKLWDDGPEAAPSFEISVSMMEKKELRLAKLHANGGIWHPAFGALHVDGGVDSALPWGTPCRRR